jgi:hypothetical protein
MSRVLRPRISPTETSSIKVDSVHLTTEIEPSVLAMSDTYIAVGFNNRALYYRMQSVGGSFGDCK